MEARGRARRSSDHLGAKEQSRAAAGGKDEDVIASAAETFRGLGEHGDDAVDLGEKRLRHQGDSHFLQILDSGADDSGSGSRLAR
jgi:hypothetical protein